jgi:hypothetical protein
MATKKTTTTKATAPSPTAELDAEIAADAAAASASPDQLSVITARAADLVEHRATMEGLLAAAADHKKEIEKLEQEVLPALMDEAQVRVIGLAGDFTLERTEKVYASISKANAPTAAQWLEESGNGALIKIEISVALEKGDTELAAKVRALLTKNRIGFEESVGVHPQTLLAFVKERLADGKPLPDSITHHIQPLVVMKAPKKKAK